MRRERIVLGTVKLPGITCGQAEALEDGTEVWCEEPAAVMVRFDEMWSERVPAFYPKGSERVGHRYTSSACLRHAGEWTGIDLTGLVG